MYALYKEYSIIARYKCVMKLIVLDINLYWV